MIYKVKVDSKEFKDKVEDIENRLLTLVLDSEDASEPTVYDAFIESMETGIYIILKNQEQRINNVELRHGAQADKVMYLQSTMEDTEFHVNRLLSILEIGLLMIDNTKFTIEEEVI